MSAPFRKSLRPPVVPTHVAVLGGGALGAIGDRHLDAARQGVGAVPGDRYHRLAILVPVLDARRE